MAAAGRWCTVVALAALLVGCSEGAGPEPTAGSPTDPSPSLTAPSTSGAPSAGPSSGLSSVSPAEPSPSEQSSPSQAPLSRDPDLVFFRDTRAVRQGDDVWFKHELVYARTRLWEITGTMSDRGVWSARMKEWDVEGRPVDVVEVRSIKDRIWMQRQDWPASQRGCWYVLSDGEVPRGISALAPGEPTYVKRLREMRPVSLEYNGDVLAEVSMRFALDLILVDWIRADKVGPQHYRTPIPVTVGFDRGRVEVYLSGTDIGDEWERTKFPVSSDWRDAIDYLDLTVRYRAIEQSSRVSAPPSRLVMREGESSCR